MSVYNIIKNEYDKRQKYAFDSLEARKSEVFAKIPRLEQIESEIHLIGVKYNKMILLGEHPADNIPDELSDKIENLKKEREMLLKQNGYPDNYLNLLYQCPLCKDTGFIDGETGTEKCSCYKQLLVDLLYKSSNMLLTETENFKCFDESYYPDTIDEKKYGIKKSPRENILGIKDKCLRFVENFNSPDEKNLFFCGPTGVGKTFMANCIAREILNKGWTVLYQTAPVLFDIISTYKVKSFKSEALDDGVYKSIFDVDLLIIDDLGTESRTATRYAELLNILNIRYTNNLSRPCKTIISTNFSMEELFEYYTERVESRIIGFFSLYKFVGEDIRKVKRQLLR
jgi:DNA replication protein DnaC